MSLPSLSSDPTFAAFAVTFPCRKPWDFGVHRSRLAELRFWCSAPCLPPHVLNGMVKGLRQWSESFAELVGRN